VIYEIDDHEHTVIVLRIDHRLRVYRSHSSPQISLTTDTGKAARNEASLVVKGLFAGVEAREVGPLPGGGAGRRVVVGSGK
jgi:hypothetical protein